MAIVKLPDGSQREVPDGSTVAQLAESIGRGLAKAAIVAKVDGKLVDTSSKLTGSHDVSIVTDRDADGLDVLRHSTAHVLAEALRRMYGAQLQYTIGPVIENGFFYDFEFPKGVNFSVDDLPKVEKEMAKIVEANEPFSREDVSPDHAKQILHSQEQRFKDEIIDELASAGEKSVSIYRQGDFTDLCRGPHIPSTGKIKAFKLQSVAGAYWRGDSNREQLTRIYGTAFFDKKQLDEHIAKLDEAKKRDHRVLGKQLSLFTISPMVGSGLILWMPKGAVLRYQLETFIREELAKRGYKQVYTPHIGNIELYKKSGHYPYYKESQFPPIHMCERTAHVEGAAATPAEASSKPQQDQDEFLLKPMNCPHHIQIYAAEPKSYRDLPVRYAEFGTVYRYEESGELNGLTRVRGFTQDDAHLFCTPEQVEEEFRNTVDLVQFVFDSLGFKDVEVRLSLRDPESPKFAGDPKLWDMAEAQLEKVLKEMKIPFVAAKGEAAFYGPKVDFMVRDVLGRKWQLGTVQLDYVLPERFGIEYTGADDKAHRPVMIHRAPFGSMERFTGILIEHFGGAFPLWLSPVQVSVLSISEKYEAYAKQVEQSLKAEGIRVEIDLGAEKIGAKIRNASMQKVPYMLILGEQEAAAGKVAVRSRTAGDQGQMTVSEFIQRCDQEISTRGASPATAEA